MKAQKSLTAKKKSGLKTKPLKRNTGSLRKSSKRTIPKLRNKADAVFSHYVRIRDSELKGGKWVMVCISCPSSYTVRYQDELGVWRWGRQEEAGHYVGRGNYYLRYDEENVNGQCTRCNKWLQGNIARYTVELDKKYGDGTAMKLVREAEAHKKDRLSVGRLEQVIADYTVALDFYLKDEV